MTICSYVFRLLLTPWRAFLKKWCANRAQLLVEACAICRVRLWCRGSTLKPRWCDSFSAFHPQVQSRLFDLASSCSFPATFLFMMWMKYLYSMSQRAIAPLNASLFFFKSFSLSWILDSHTPLCPVGPRYSLKCRLRAATTWLMFATKEDMVRSYLIGIFTCKGPSV